MSAAEGAVSDVRARYPEHAGEEPEHGRSLGGGGEGEGELGRERPAWDEGMMGTSLQSNAYT
jgi:hypothetical protein